MAAGPEAYVDTSALIAFADRSDDHHPLFRRLFADPPGLITTSFVVAEGHGWFLRRYDRQRALRFAAMIESITPLEVLSVGQAELAAAARLLARFGDQDFTLADAVGLHLGVEHRVSTMWSTDRHLGLTGVPLVVGRERRRRG